MYFDQWKIIWKNVFKTKVTILKKLVGSFFTYIKTPIRQCVPSTWHYTIWSWGFSNAEVLGNMKYSFIVLATRSTLEAPDRIVSMGQIEVFDLSEFLRRNFMILSLWVFGVLSSFFFFFVIVIYYGNNNKDEDNSPKNLNDKKKFMTVYLCQTELFETKRFDNLTECNQTTDF